MYYFAKPFVSKFRLDMDAVNRLAGAFDVTPRELERGAKDLKIENDAVVVHVIYGGEAQHHRYGSASHLVQVQNVWGNQVTTGWSYRIRAGS